jgi:hypothetical protein
MAQSFTTQDGITLINPGTYVSVTVRPNQGGIATAGVVTIIGEADEGPGFLDEENLADVVFSPSQVGKVLAKYGSGRIVEAFQALTSAANDPNILGAVNQIRIVKTNQSVKSQASVLSATSDAFAQLKARRAGLAGNLIRYFSATAQSETAPTTGIFSYTPRFNSTSFGLRINGQTLKSVSVPAKTADISALIEDVAAGIMCKGGKIKNVLSTAGITISASVLNAQTLLVTLQTGNTWSSAPKVGDTALIPQSGDYGAAQDSALAGLAGQNAGTYIVQAVTNTPTSATLTLKAIETVGALVSSTGTVAADLTDIILVSEVEIKNVSGDRRLSTVGVDGTYQTTLNNGSTVTIQAPAQWAKQPKAGDTVKFEALFAGIEPGFYQVTSSTADSMTMVRLSDGSSGSFTASQLVTGPVTEANEPFKVLTKTIKGLGKTLCVEGSVDSIFKSADGTSAQLSNQQKISQAEEKNIMTYTKGSTSESFTSGGEIVLAVGSTEALAEMSIGSEMIEFKVAGITRFSASFKQFRTMADLASYISSQTGFSATVTSSKFNSLQPSSLDKGTFSISGLASHKNGRIKRDASAWLAQNSASALVEASLQSQSGLPEVTSTEKYLEGGSKGGTTSALVVAAIDAIEKLDTNFVVPLFSVDATEDIALEQTESSSTYSVDAINSYVQAHVLKMSAIKMRKNRIGIVSKRASYEDCKEAAGNLNSFRMYLCFEDMKAPGSTEFSQPYMAAVVAAGMQSAAGYKGIVKKFANTAGTRVPFGDFDASNPGDTEDALTSGLLFTEKVPTGGYRWFSDQSTYTVDNNFVYNSLQAVYISDLIVLTLIERFDRLVVGKSVAEISAATALSILEAEMFNFKRLRWIASSDDAIKGYKNPSATITGPVLEISCEIKLAGLIYFVPISLTVSEVQQSA